MPTTVLFPCRNAAWLCWGALELVRTSHRMVLSMLPLSWALSAKWHPVSDWVVPSSNRDKNVEIEEQTCLVVSMWDNWMSLLSSWAQQCLLWGAIPTCGEGEDAGYCWFAGSWSHFHGHPAPLQPLVPACSLLLAVIPWGTLVQEHNFRSLMKTGDWRWEVTDKVYQSTLSSWSLEIEEFCPNNVVVSVQSHPEKRRLWAFSNYGLNQARLLW